MAAVKARKEVYHESSNIRVQILRSDYKRILEMLSEYQFNKKQRCNSLISADVCLVRGVWLSGQCLLIVTMLLLPLLHNPCLIIESQRIQGHEPLHIMLGTFSIMYQTLANIISCSPK